MTEEHEIVEIIHVSGYFIGITNKDDFLLYMEEDVLTLIKRLKEDKKEYFFSAQAFIYLNSPFLSIEELAKKAQIEMEKIDKYINECDIESLSIEEEFKLFIAMGKIKSEIMNGTMLEVLKPFYEKFGFPKVKDYALVFSE